MALAFGPLLKGFGLHHNLQSQPGCIVAELCILLLWSLNTFSRFDQVIFLLVHVIHVPFQQGSGAHVFHGFDVLPQSRLVLKDPWKLARTCCLRDDNQVSTRSTFFGSVYLYWVFLASSCINMFTKHVHQTLVTLFQTYAIQASLRPGCCPYSACVDSLWSQLSSTATLEFGPKSWEIQDIQDTKLGLLSSTQFYLR